MPPLEGSLGAPATCKPSLRPASSSRPRPPFRQAWGRHAGAGDMPAGPLCKCRPRGGKRKGPTASAGTLAPSGGCPLRRAGQVRFHTTLGLFKSEDREWGKPSPNSSFPPLTSWLPKRPASGSGRVTPGLPPGATRAGLPLGFRSPQASGSRRCGVPPPRHPGGEGCPPSLPQGEPAPRIPEAGPDRHGSLGRAAPQGRGLDSLGGVGPLEGQRPRPLEAAPRVRPALMLHLVGEEPWRGEVCVWGAPGALRSRACRPPVKCSVLPRRGLRRPEVSVRTDSAAAALQPLWGCVSERDIAPPLRAPTAEETGA